MQKVLMAETEPETGFPAEGSVVVAADRRSIVLGEHGACKSGAFDYGEWHEVTLTHACMRELLT